MSETVEKLKQRFQELRILQTQSIENIDASLKIASMLILHDTRFTIQVCESIIEAANLNNYERGRAEALRILGWCQTFTDQYIQAAQTLKESYQIFVKHNDYIGQASTLCGLANSLKQLVSNELAIANYIAALRLYEKLGRQVQVKGAAVLNNLGIAYKLNGEYSTALDYFYQALTIAIENGDGVLQSQIYSNLGDILWRVDEADNAINYLQQALSLAETHYLPNVKAVAYLNLGNARQSLKYSRKTLEEYQCSLALAQASGSVMIEADAQTCIGNVYLEEENVKTALPHFMESLQLSRKIGNSFCESEALLGTGFAYGKLGDLRQSGEAFEQALEISQHCNYRQIRYKTHLALSELHEKLGDAKSALAHYQHYHQDWQAVHGAGAARRIERSLCKQKLSGLPRASQHTLKQLRQTAGNSRPDFPRSEIGATLPPRKLKEVMAFIDHNLENSIGSSDLAEVANLNQNYFTRSFKHSTGKTPHQFLLEKRVERAKQLLLNTRLPVSEIALQCGFSSQSHLTSQFHVVTGTTPHKFRHFS